MFYLKKGAVYKPLKALKSALKSKCEPTLEKNLAFQQMNN